MWMARSWILHHKNAPAHTPLSIRQNSQFPSFHNVFPACPSACMCVVTSHSNSG
jgi:hypothetical protein